MNGRGACVGAPQDALCDDADACTIDACDPSTGCTHTALPASACDDGNLCTDDACVPATGCTHTDNALPCDDGVACTGADTCGGGACAGTPDDAACEDGEPCTQNTCDPALGCQTDPSALFGTQCDDDDACTFPDVCGFDGACDPGCPVHLEAGVVLVEARDLAGVQAHPDPDRLAVREGMSLQRALGLDGGQQGVQRRVEDVEEGIADGPDLDAAAGAEGAADQPIVLIQHLREARPEPLDQLGRALDVAEEDRQPTLGQVLHPPRRAGPKLTTGSAAAGRASRPR